MVLRPDSITHFKNILNSQILLKFFNNRGDLSIAELKLRIVASGNMMFRIHRISGYVYNSLLEGLHYSTTNRKHKSKLIST